MTPPESLLAFIEEEARRRGATRLTLFAQVRARSFYDKAGYAAASREFDDGTGIPHLRMEKNA